MKVKWRNLTVCTEFYLLFKKGREIKRGVCACICKKETAEEKQTDKNGAGGDSAGTGLEAGLWTQLSTQLLTSVTSELHKFLYAGKYIK